MHSSFHHIHTKQIDAIAGDDNDFKLELINIFLEQIDEFTTNMKALLESGDWKNLAKEAHTAKSSAMTFGMDNTGKLLKKIQLECEANKTDNAPRMVQEAIDQLQSAIPELSSLKESF